MGGVRRYRFAIIGCAFCVKKYQIDYQIKHFAAIISIKYRFNNCFI